MAAITQVAVLFCGQGMATLIEYYAGGDRNAAPDNLVLVDFGGNQKYSEEAAAYVVGKLKMQATPKFDLVIISHQDGDHLSLLGALTDAINTEGLTVGCDDWYAGGLVWSAANKKRVTNFAAAMSDDDDDIAFNCPRESNYEGATDRDDLGHLCNFGSTYIRVLISGVKLSKAPEDITRNASSAVIVVENGADAVILPGDATYHTMKVVNDYYASWGGTSLVPPVFTLEIPHHGALRTAVENYSAQTPLAELDFSIITSFAGYTNPDIIVASAGPLNTHCHPVKEVLDVFSGGLVAHPKHNYVAWVFDLKKATKHDGWRQYESSKGVLTTVKEVVGNIVWGDQLFYMEDASSTAPASVKQEFRPRGLLSELMAAHLAREAAGEGPDRSPRTEPRDTILRAPPPGVPPKPRRSATS